MECVCVCVWGGGASCGKGWGTLVCGRRGGGGRGGWGGGGKWRGVVSGAELPTSPPPPSSSSSPPSRSVCEPLAVTCSTRTDVSACWRAHATLGEKPEPEVRHRSVFPFFFPLLQNLTHLPAREQLDQVGPNKTSDTNRAAKRIRENPRGCTCCPPAACAPCSSPSRSSAEVSHCLIKPAGGCSLLTRRRRYDGKVPAGACEKLQPRLIDHISGGRGGAGARVAPHAYKL